MSYHGDLISGKLPNFEISRFGTQNLEISRFDMQNLVFTAKSWEKNMAWSPTFRGNIKPRSIENPSWRLALFQNFLFLFEEIAGTNQKS